MSVGTENPRNVAGQAVRGSDHWGRESETAELWRRLERESVLLTAPRRYGKTSLMFSLQDAPLPGWRVLYLNVEYVTDGAEFANELVAALLREGGVPVATRLRHLGGGLGRWFGDVIGESSVGVPDVAELKLRLKDRLPADWRPQVEALWRSLVAANEQTLVILDELPVMLDSMVEADRPAALRFLHWFRALRGVGGRFLVGGSVNIEPVLRSLGESALLNDLGRFRLRPFTETRAAEFVAAVFKGEGDVVPDGLATAFVRTAATGVPFFLQVYVDEALSEARARRVMLGEALAAEVFQENVLGPRCASRFSHYLERLRHYGASEGAARQVLHEAAHNPSVPLPRIHELAREAGMDPDRLLTRLESDWYIDRDGDGVRFADGFVRAWWRRNAPMGRSR